MRNPLLLIVELLSAIGMTATGSYRTYTMLRDRRDAKRDAEDEARYQARKDEQRRQQADGVRLTKDPAGPAETGSG